MNRPIALALAGILTLSACQVPPGTAPPPIAVRVNAIAADVSLLASVTPQLVAAIAGMGRVSPAEQARLVAIQSAIQATASEVAADAAGVATASEARQIGAAVNEMVLIAHRYGGLSPSLGVLVDASAALVPAILAAAGMVAATPVAPRYSPDQARTILAAHVR